MTMYNKIPQYLYPEMDFSTTDSEKAITMFLFFEGITFEEYAAGVGIIDDPSEGLTENQKEDCCLCILEDINDWLGGWETRMIPLEE